MFKFTIKKQISKIIAVIMTLSLCFCFSSCGKLPEGDGNLPFDLSFGISYDDFVSILDSKDIKATELTKSPVVGSKYYTAILDRDSYLEQENAWEFMGSDTLNKEYSTFNPVITAFFNSEKKLCEIEIVFNFDDDSETELEEMMNEFIKHYRESLNSNDVEEEGDKYTIKNNKMSFSMDTDCSGILPCKLQSLEYDLYK